MKKRVVRNSGSGHAMLELPVVLFLIIVCLFFPILDLAVIGYRSTFLFSAARSAAQTAGRAKTFSSACKLAEERVDSVVEPVRDVSVDHVQVRILRTARSATLNSSRVEGRLPESEDTGKNNYQIEVLVTGRVEPFARICFVNIAGVGAPLPLKAIGRSFVEVPNGLKH